MKLLKASNHSEETFNIDQVAMVDFGAKVMVTMSNGARFVVSNPDSVEILKEHIHIPPQMPVKKARKKSTRNLKK